MHKDTPLYEHNPTTTSKMLVNYPDVLNVKQLSQILGVSTKTGYGLLKNGNIAFLLIGNSYRIPKTYLLSYLYSAKKSNELTCTDN